MGNSTWKSYERRLARSFGTERAAGSHGPDFIVPINGVEYRGEAKKRSSDSGLRTILGWLMARDVLFIGLKHKRDEDSLVVMRKSTFDELYRWNTAVPIQGKDYEHDIDSQELIDASSQ